MIKKVSVRELSRSTSEIIRFVEGSGTPIVVSRHDRPVAFFVPFGSQMGQDIALSLSVEHLGLLSAAELDHLEGRTIEWERCPIPWRR